MTYFDVRFPEGYNKGIDAEGEGEESDGFEDVYGVTFKDDSSIVHWRCGESTIENDTNYDEYGIAQELVLQEKVVELLMKIFTRANVAYPLN